MCYLIARHKANHAADQIIGQGQRGQLRKTSKVVDGGEPRAWVTKLKVETWDLKILEDLIKELRMKQTTIIGQGMKECYRKTDEQLTVG